MNLDALKELMHARPFVPFVLHTADGRSFEVSEPVFISITRNGRIARVATDEYQGEGFESLNLLQLIGATTRESLQKPQDDGGSEA